MSGTRQIFLTRKLGPDLQKLSPDQKSYKGPVLKTSRTPHHRLDLKVYYPTLSHNPQSAPPYNCISMDKGIPKIAVYAAAAVAAAGAGAALHQLYQNIKSKQQQSKQAITLNETDLFAAVELGGTSCRAAVAYASDPKKLIAVHEVDTTTPDATLSDINQFLEKHRPFISLGVASFGPIDLNKESKTYGYITTTPKPGWQNCNLLSYFKHYNVPIGFDTDVNAPALAELQYGDHKDWDSCAYITVGTGIGVGVVVNGNPVHGLVHPEGGHIMVLRPKSDQFEGWSKLHQFSVESMASAKACAGRANVDALELANLKDDNPIWDDIAYYLAQLCLTICYVVSPHVIVMSGGVMKRQVLFEKCRKKFIELNEGYISSDRLSTRNIDGYLVPSKYGNDIGIIGGIELARRAAINK